MNMVGSAQVNRTEADDKAAITQMKKHEEKLNLWQRNNLLFAFAAWSNNSIVKSLSNFHSPVIIPIGVQQQIKIDKVRQCKPVGIPVALQQIDYSKTFNLIDKGNSAEIKYDDGGNTYV